MARTSMILLNQENKDYSLVKEKSLMVMKLPHQSTNPKQLPSPTSFFSVEIES